MIGWSGFCVIVFCCSQTFATNYYHAHNSNQTVQGSNLKYEFSTLYVLYIYIYIYTKREIALIGWFLVKIVYIWYILIVHL